MVQCERCQKEHNGSYGSGRFCSAPCARSFATVYNREATSRKVAETLKGRKHEFSLEERQRQVEAQKKTKLQKLLEADFDSLSIETKKKRVVLEQNGKCFRCGINEWLGKPLTLQVDHEDGDSQNDRRDNLRGLCPNCHSQTPTYCGKNRGKHHRLGDYEITDERLLVALLSTRSIGAALKSLGKSRTHDAYLRCKALLKQHSVTLVETLAECGFCHSGVDRPYEDDQMRFCNRSCAGKYRVAAKQILERDVEEN